MEKAGTEPVNQRALGEGKNFRPDRVNSIAPYSSHHQNERSLPEVSAAQPRIQTKPAKPQAKTIRGPSKT
ncbi:MAG: hypothetical protein PHT48_09500, partial [Dechloromonas sp.]|nr:hypothetical protein [Dechloromonas sp.]